MLFRRPCYYDTFTCTAEKCTDNCCIGWEICIDSETAEFYKSVGGELGKRLEKNICGGDEPSFIMKDGRCPFLNQNNLCDIISSLGENALCQICTDHPRWFEWYGDEKEGGIGLSCEEGARLILQEEGFADYFESECNDLPDEDFDKNVYGFLFAVRDSIFDILTEEGLSFTQRANRLIELSSEAEAELCGRKSTPEARFDFNTELKNALSVLAKTQPIDEKWTAELNRLKASPPVLEPDGEQEKYLTRLTAYFVWRYFLSSVFDYRVREKIAFALFSVTVISALYHMNEERDFSTLVKSAVLYSKQMEYSEENLDIFFESYNEKEFLQ